MEHKKTLLTWSLSILSLLLTINLVLNACQQDEKLNQDRNPDQVFFSKFKINGNQININSYNELNSHIEKMLNDGTQITATELRKSEDDSFYYLYSKGQKGELSSTIGIPLNFDPGGTVLNTNGDGCTHRCDQAAFNPCTTCDLTIHERCKRQSCTCKTENGACDGSIVFTSESPM